MYPAERHQRILEQAHEAGRVEVNALAELLDVTPETVRRDLTVLERHGQLRRVHGGAVLLEVAGYEPRLADRQQRHVEQKLSIAKAALAELPAEGTILLDAGSSTEALAEQLPRDRTLTVVTNSVSVAALLAHRDDVTLFMIGGRVRGRTLAAVGEWSRHALAGISVDVAFMGTNGLTVARGLTTPDQDEAVVKHGMIAAAHRVVVLADSSKVGTDHFAQIAALDEVDTVVTDAGLERETAIEIEAAGPIVVRA